MMLRMHEKVTLMAEGRTKNEVVLSKELVTIISRVVKKQS